VSEIYVAGKIAGLEPELARDYFLNARKQLEDVGLAVITPYDIPACEEKGCNGAPDPYTAELIEGGANDPREYIHTWECYLRHDLAYVLHHCKGIAQLHNWMDSPGARLESYVGASCGLDVRAVQGWL